MTVRMITAEPGVGVPVRRAVTLDFVGWRAVVVVVLTILVLGRFGVAGPIRYRGHAQRKRRGDRHRTRRDDLFHGVLVTSHRLAAVFSNQGLAHRQRRCAKFVALLLRSEAFNCPAARTP